MTRPNDKLRVNPGYALGQLMRALGSTGETAGARASQWRRVLTGMFAGTLHPGSRTPVADTPPWVTLQVVHGGFATGEFLALEGRFRQEDPTQDAAQRVLWTGFERWLVERFPGAERVATPFREPLYPDEQWQQFLRLQGYTPFTLVTFAKEVPVE